MPAVDSYQDAQLFSAKVQENCEHITNLTEVLQGEQDRATAAAIAADSDRARLDELAKELRTLKVLRQQDIHTIDLLRKDVVSLEERMGTAHGNLQSHGSEHRAAAERLANLEGDMDKMRQRATALEDRSDMAHNGLASAVQRATQQANDLEQLQLALSKLKSAHEVSEQRREELASAHGKSSNSLQELMGTTLPAMVEQASMDRLTLDAACNRLAALETEQLTSVTHQLHGLQSLADTSSHELQAAQGQLEAVTASLQQLESSVRQESETAKITRVELQDSKDRIHHLQGVSNDAGAGLRRNHDDLAELRSNCRQQASQVSGLAEALASLRLDLQTTYDELGALSALVQVGNIS